MKNLKLLDCTLRDGSYVNNFNFSKRETFDIVQALDGAGLEYIEIGHGMGLGASEKGFGPAKETDETYIRAAIEARKNAKLGVFCIPGIANLEDLSVAAEYGINFIRIGSEPHNFKKAIPFIERAKQLNLNVCINFMKSYTVSYHDFADYVIPAYNLGIDYVYIVDSAGGMLPSELINYIHAVKDAVPEQKLGFHGHNNLGMAVANSLLAYENGVELIDVSLRGLGRGAGNTYSEQFISAIKRQKKDFHIDPLLLGDIGEEYILKYSQQQHVSSIDVISGFAQFHSSYLPIIKKYAFKYNIDPRKLIVAVCEEDKLNAPEFLVEKKAKELFLLGYKGEWKQFYQEYIGGEQTL